MSILTFLDLRQSVDGHMPLPILSSELLNQQLDAIFTPILDESRSEVAIQLANGVRALENLSGFYVVNRFGPSAGDSQSVSERKESIAREVLGALQFDHLGMLQLLKLFQRDAFGVKRFHSLLKKDVAADSLDDDVFKKIISQLDELGIRINSEEPRKTRVAAAFSLWMANWRPVSVKVSALKSIPPDRLTYLCTWINFWISCSYLQKFGTVDLGDDGDIRLERIRHDLTVRHLRLSSLETFYVGIFRRSGNSITAQQA